MKRLEDGERLRATGWPRRSMIKLLAGTGAGAVFARSLVTLAAQDDRVTEKMIQRAEWIAGVEFTEDERKLMLDGINELMGDLETMREVPLDNAVAPALIFQPLVPGATSGDPQRRVASPIESAPPALPGSDEDLAFAPVTELSALIRSKRISCVELARLYLDRLERFGSVLECVVEYAHELAVEQAERADRELARGLYRGPLHGIPWGAKDLLAVPGYRTTWGAKPYEEQIRPELSTVAARLEESGAALAAKLTLGALAWGDVWYGGKTRNPWKKEEGSSGSSAGPAAATAAGLIGFSIGSETWGSIVSPCTRCGVTGLRPTFGRISRHGAMALSWSMDKLGPIARSVEDCALVFDAIRGADGLDPTVVDGPFTWPPRRDVRSLKVGYVADLFEEDRTVEIEEEDAKRRAVEWQEFDRRSLEVLKQIGLQLVPVKLPETYPVGPLSLILTAEATAAFDDLTRSGLDDLLVRQEEYAWPNVFRQGQMIPAVEYIRANRIRTLLLQGMEKLMREVDVYVCPTYGGDNLLLTNLTGHPSVVLPNGFHSEDGTPTSITFCGRLHGETDLLAVAHAYQQATEFHLARPPLG